MYVCVSSRKEMKVRAACDHTFLLRRGVVSHIFLLEPCLVLGFEHRMVLLKRREANYVVAISRRLPVSANKFACPNGFLEFLWKTMDNSLKVYQQLASVSLQTAVAHAILVQIDGVVAQRPLQTALEQRWRGPCLSQGRKHPVARTRELAVVSCS